MTELIDHEQRDKETGAATRYSATLEELLRDHFNAIGQTLGQKLKSVQDHLPRRLMRDLWHVIHQRNDAAHSSTHKFENFPKFELAFQQAIKDLKRLIELRAEKENGLENSEIARTVEQEIDAVDQENHIVPIRLGGAGWTYLGLKENPFLVSSCDENDRANFVFTIKRSEISRNTKYVSNPFLETGFDVDFENSEEFRLITGRLPQAKQEEELRNFNVDVPEQSQAELYKFGEEKPSTIQLRPFQWFVVAVIVFFVFEAIYSVYTKSMSSTMILLITVGIIWLLVKFRSWSRWY